ncbi:ABC transporter ATP-binding protein [Aestuariimicrobium soli]|uniref:ABC transporter ATP-binding protein n=1 Tax=Aestuariimicrobium soli TaxID=2035834 RepID=UPI003EC04595
MTDAPLTQVPPIVQVRDLVKEFTRPVTPTGRFAELRRLFTRRTSTTRAVDGVSFDIAPGELVGYLGANGAGKSTTIKMLTGILVPTSGEILVDGRVPWQNRRANALSIGAVFGQRTQLWYDLPLRDSLELIRDLYAVDEADYRRRLGEFTELLGLDEFLDTPVRQLSLGQRMRGDLVAALIYEPKVLYLDEPTIGLDVVAKQRIRDFIAELNARTGTTVMLTTHDMEDIETLCRRIILIDAGTVLYDGDVTTLKRRYIPDRELVVTPAPEVDPHDITPEGGTTIVRDGRAVISHDPATVSTPELIGRVTSRWQITDLTVTEPPLADVISRIYTDQGR